MSTPHAVPNELSPGELGRLSRLALALPEPGETYDCPLGAAVRANIRLDAFMESQNQTVVAVLRVREQERKAEQERARAAAMAMMGGIAQKP